MATETESKVLVVSPNDRLRGVIAAFLASSDYSSQIECQPRLMTAFDPKRYSLIILDREGPDHPEASLMTWRENQRTPIPVILLSQGKNQGFSGHEAPVHTLIKPFGLAEFRVALEKAMCQERRPSCITRQSAHSPDQYRLPRIVRESPRTREFFDEALKYARSEGTVLLLGESGSGKEVAARLIHDQSRRSTGPFVAVNCAAIPSALIESELFGYVKGAFSGADRDRAGRVATAKGGTLFLDEIAEIAPELQAKLNRLLENREYHPVGSDIPAHADVRIIAATNADLGKLIACGGFREDLFHRLNVLTLRIPPLRERVEDIPALAQLFACEVASRDGKPIPSFNVAAMRALKMFPWPGNIRELRGVVDRTVVSCQSSEIDLCDLPMEVQKGTPARERRNCAESSAPITKAQLLEALDRSKGNATAASKLLCCSRQHVYLLEAKYGITRAKRR